MEDSLHTSKFTYNRQPIQPEHVFIERRYVFGMVHHKPVTDGHVLICPMRQNVYSIAELTELEVLEMFVCAREVVKVFDEVFKVKNFMILVNEGEMPLAIQVLPREDSMTSTNLPENAHRIG